MNRSVISAILAAGLALSPTSLCAKNNKTPGGDPCGAGNGKGVGNPCGGNNGNAGANGNATDIRASPTRATTTTRRRSPSLAAPAAALSLPRSAMKTSPPFRRAATRSMRASIRRAMAITPVCSKAAPAPITRWLSNITTTTKRGSLSRVQVRKWRA